MAFAGAVALFSNSCFSALWKRFKRALGYGEQEVQEEVDCQGHNQLRVENVITCCGGRTMNVTATDLYAR